MNKVANAYWLDNRLRSQRVAVRRLPVFVPARELSRELVGTATDVRRRGGIVPSWVVFAMIILATMALCISVTMRTRTEMLNASLQYQKASADVEALRNDNQQLAKEVQRLQSDPRAIESAARSRLNMVRANEIIVPIE